MKKYFVMMFALALGADAANAQEVTNTETVKAAEQTQAVSLCKEVYPDAERDGGLYHGLTRKLSFDRMIPPHGLEVTRPCTSSFRLRCATSISARRI